VRRVSATFPLNPHHWIIPSCIQRQEPFSNPLTLQHQNYYHAVHYLYPCIIQALSANSGTIQAPCPKPPSSIRMAIDHQLPMIWLNIIPFLTMLPHIPPPAFLIQSLPPIWSFLSFSDSSQVTSGSHSPPTISLTTCSSILLHDPYSDIAYHGPLLHHHLSPMDGVHSSLDSPHQDEYK